MPPGAVTPPASHPSTAKGNTESFLHVASSIISGRPGSGAAGSIHGASLVLRDEDCFGDRSGTEEPKANPGCTISVRG